MYNLLKAGFLRLGKSRAFWLCTIAHAAVAVLFVVFSLGANQFEYGKSDGSGVLFVFPLTGLFLYAVCISLLVGTEYSDGTIRNKLIVGGSRTAIYLTNWITSVVSSLVISISYIVVLLALGVAFIGPITMPPAIMGGLFGLSLCTVVAASSLCTMIAMVCSSRTHTAILSLLLTLVLLFAGTYFRSRLEEPEYYDSYVYAVNGVMQYADPEPNPNYLRGSARKTFELMYDLDLGGQALQLGKCSVDRPAQFVRCDLGIVLVTTAAGVLLFRRKDVK